MPEKYLVQYIHYADGRAQAMLERVWRRIAADRLAEDLFYDGSVRTWPEFRAQLLRPGCLPFMAYANGELAMFTWLNSLEGKMARSHFAVFRQFWGRKKRIPLGQHLYRHILALKDERGHLLDCLYGITPAANRLALNAVLACGWEKRGVIPHACQIQKSGQIVDGVLTCATREILGIGHADS